MNAAVDFSSLFTPEQASKPGMRAKIVQSLTERREHILQRSAEFIRESGELEEQAATFATVPVYDFWSSLMQTEPYASELKRKMLRRARRLRARHVKYNKRAAFLEAALNALAACA